MCESQRKSHSDFISCQCQEVAVSKKVVWNLFLSSPPPHSVSSTAARTRATSWWTSFIRLIEAASWVCGDPPNFGRGREADGRNLGTITLLHWRANELWLCSWSFPRRTLVCEKSLQHSCDVNKRVFCLLPYLLAASGVDRKTWPMHFSTAMLLRLSSTVLQSEIAREAREQSKGSSFDLLHFSCKTESKSERGEIEEIRGRAKSSLLLLLSRGGRVGGGGRALQLARTSCPPASSLSASLSNGDFIHVEQTISWGTPSSHSTQRPQLSSTGPPRTCTWTGDSPTRPVWTNTTVWAKSSCYQTWMGALPMDVVWLLRLLQTLVVEPIMLAWLW